jgi:ribosomal-protein-alanine N-acetyltransferase
VSDAAAPRFSIRLPLPGDARALDAAEKICFVDPWPGQCFVSELLAAGRFQRVVVDESGILAAYLFTAWQYLDLHVLKVATLPEYRRHGLARRLMRLAEDHTAELGGESVTLEVRPSNRGAIGLYASMGYEMVGRRPGYYANGEDGLIMTKRIVDSLAASAPPAAPAVPKM